ncbi:hypothetical protein H0A66_16605 [Alcaligenaceae bacterium]|nr:hypothetical protein [Alcaligenaceae bacterium]
MSNLSAYDIARHFCMDDIPAAAVPATRLSNILEQMYCGHSLTAPSLQYLLNQQFIELHLLAVGLASYEAFVATAAPLQKAREEAREQVAKAERLAKEVERRAWEAEWSAQYQRELEAAERARKIRESDPEYIAKMRRQALLSKYQISCVNQPVLTQIIDILNCIEFGKRLAKSQVIWLKATVRHQHFTKVLEAYHRIEAEYFSKKYRRSKDPWSAVNASGHYRKSNQPEAALELLDCVQLNRLNGSKIKSAVCTTRGGAMRDLGRLNEARQLGEQAHKLQPTSFHPCTLLGAVHMRLRNFEQAQEWYEKAEERGASRSVIDSDIRFIFQQADKTERQAIKDFLLKIDPDRYSWVKGKKYQSTQAFPSVSGGLGF